MPIKDAPLIEAIGNAVKGSRKGRKKVISLIKKRNPKWSSSSIRRVYEQQGFSLHRRLKKRIQRAPVKPLVVPLSPNEEWAVDYMSDRLTNGRQIRILNVIDEYNRQGLTSTIGHSIPARRLTAVLDQIIEKKDKPKSIRTDNGPEFTSKWFQLWLKKNNIEWVPIQRGKPQQNAFIERFNRTYREDVLDANLFFSAEHAQRVTDQFLKEYNQERPHESLKFLTPMEYAA